MSNTVEIDLDVITNSLDELKDKRARLSFELKQTEKDIDKYEQVLGLFLKQNKLDNLTYGRFEFGFVERTRKAFDQKLFQEEQPELFEKYKIEKTSEKLEFKLL